jgi:predicted nuclease of predicted toxin-antitoxin system
MRFLADMGVAMRVVEWLRDQGYDARHLREEELQRLPDDQIFRKAVAENRVVLTLDLDFGEIVAFSGQQNVSVVLFRLQNTRTPHVIDRLHVVLQAALSALAEQLLSSKNRAFASGTYLSEGELGAILASGGCRKPKYGNVDECRMNVPSRAL